MIASRSLANMKIPPQASLEGRLPRQVYTRRRLAARDWPPPPRRHRDASSYTVTGAVEVEPLRTTVRNVDLSDQSLIPYAGDRLLSWGVVLRRFQIWCMRPEADEPSKLPKLQNGHSTLSSISALVDCMIFVRVQNTALTSSCVGGQRASRGDTVKQLERARISTAPLSSPAFGIGVERGAGSSSRETFPGPILFEPS